MSNSALCISIVTLAIIKSSLSIQIVSSSAPQYCLGKTDEDLTYAGCNHQVERQQFYLSGDLTKWQSPHFWIIQLSTKICGLISTPCPINGKLFLTTMPNFQTFLIQFSYAST